MDNIEFYCPYCARKTSLKASLQPVGKRKKCKGCGNIFMLTQAMTLMPKSDVPEDKPLGKIGKYNILKQVTPHTVMAQHSDSEVYVAIHSVPLVEISKESYCRFAADFKKTLVPLAESGMLRLYDLKWQANEAPSLIHVIQEYIWGNSLSSLLEQQHRLIEKHALKIAATAAAVLEFAQKRNLCHGELTMSSVLIDKLTCKARIANFGIAPLLRQHNLKRDAGSFDVEIASYFSPRLSQNQFKYCIEEDIYCLGIMLCHLLGGELPFSEYGQQVTAILKAKASGKISDRIKKLLTQLSPQTAAIVTRSLGGNNGYHLASELRQDIASALEKM